MFGLRCSTTAARAALPLAVAAVLTAGVLASPAAAGEASTTATPPTLAGGWAPLNRCPVDDPAMLAADGATVVSSCLASSSSGGSITLGSSTVATGLSNLQFGLVYTRGTYTIAAPSGGAILAEPVRIPGGLLGLMCPSNIPLVSEICRAIENGALNTVTATVEPAGAPTEFNLGAGLSVGVPILRLPVKVHLENPFLGSNCFIGTDANPIVLRPENLNRPAGSIARFDPDGTANPAGEMGYVVASGADQGDSTFAVPGASGCGLVGLLDSAVNLKQGLPSPAGSNNVVLNDATTYVGGFFTPSQFVPDQGRQLASRWHAAVVAQ